MLQQVADGVGVHQSRFMQSNAVVVQGAAGVLLIDAGVTADELAALAAGLPGPVVAGFSTHPHWDHLLWHPALGHVPRYGTAAAAGAIANRLATPGWEAMVSGMIPGDIVAEVPLDDRFGRITGLPSGAGRIPWDGPEVRIIEHQAHAFGHAALLLPDRGVLVAGDMLSDVLVPILNAMAPDPVGDYLTGLRSIEDATTGDELVIPGHGSVGSGLRERIAQDRAYLEALRDRREPEDARIGAAAKPGWEFVSELHAGQVERLG